MHQFSTSLARKLTDAERAAFLHIACLKAGWFVGNLISEYRFCAEDSVNLTLVITMKEIEEYMRRLPQVENN